ncbi:MAG: hypothetical protein R3D02_10965 [Hyphomicrobiales bacterium]
MRKNIQTQLFKMLVVLGLVLGLVAWKHNFVWTGINSNLYLNGTIIGTYLFGVVLVFRMVLGLKNEEHAFASLQEVYEDLRTEKTRGGSDPFWRHYRCLEPGIVFERPKIFGHIFEITLEELLRTKHLRVSVETMQNLVRGIDTRLADERSLLAYVTGILVFLGLIGTFIGLMDMVSSVGGIIGSLAGGGGGDPSAAFAKLITDLQAPLVGMATGFSSSLFGLFTSLTLGLMSRFGNQATGVLKSYFEAWLAGVAQIEKDEDDDHGGQQAGAGNVALEALAAGVSQSMSRAEESFAEAASFLKRMSDLQAEQGAFFRQATESLNRLVEQQDDMKKRLGSIAEVDVGARIDKIGASFEGGIAKGFAGLAEAMQKASLAEAEALRQLAAHQQDIRAALASMPEGSVAASELKAIGEAIEGGIAKGFAEVSHSFDMTLAATAALMRRAQAGAVSGDGATSGDGVATGAEAPWDETGPELEDHEELVRDLYAKVAGRYGAAGRTGG